MTVLAVIFMTIALVFVVTLVSWCYFRVLTKSPGKPGPGPGHSGRDN